MHSASLAPELSAILRIDSCWIIAASPGLLDDVDQAPPLQFGQRPRLHDADHVPLLRLARLVVRVVLLRAYDLLAVERVRDSPLDGDDQRLLLFRADDGADAHLARAA